ncbi:MAG: trimethylamine methyltransferase family protein [Acidobacteria bacterium]|nr:trimethylamine methyltransferase family protein [Acidobacteriota bacterium]
MNTGFRSQVVPEYRLLTENQIQEFHRAALEVNEKIGARINSEEGVELLKQHGCTVTEGNMVLIPNYLVEECLASAPSRIDIYNRKGEEAMHLEGRNIYFGLGTDLINSYDVYTGEMRPSLLKDAANASRVTDYCSHIDFVSSYALPHDVPTNTAYVESVKTMFENTVKPIFSTAAGLEDLKFIVEMAETVVGGADELRVKPCLIHYSEPTGPLVHSYGAVRKLFYCADKGLPITYAPGDLLGGSAPVTLAGGIVQALAEVQAGIVLHQLRRKGAPIISGWAVVPMDMRTCTLSYGAPEFRLTNSAYSDIFHWYGIPMWSTVGSDAHVFDEQASMEHAFTTLMAALDGANLIHDVGYMGQGLIGNPAMVVMCNEIISYVKRLMRGFEMNREMMAIEEIRKVGAGGTHLAEEYTMKYFKQELWDPALSNRDDIAVWKQKGSCTYSHKVVHKTMEILETHRPEELPGDVKDKLGAIAERADKELAGIHFVA